VVSSSAGRESALLRGGAAIAGLTAGMALMKLTVVRNNIILFIYLFYFFFVTSFGIDDQRHQLIIQVETVKKTLFDSFRTLDPSCGF
jgi:hypothetical protein